MPLLHEIGLSNDQAAKLIDGYAKIQGESWQQMQTQATESASQSVESLRGEWGAAYDANVEMANRAFKTVAGSDAEAIAGMPLADGTSFGDNPAVVKMFHQIGTKMREDAFVGDKSGGGHGGVMSPEAAQAEIQRIENSPEHQKILMDENHYEHQPLQKRLNSLYSQAYPEPAA